MALRFHLAGINNQNFLMRDEQTGTYWQQITGRAVSGKLAGRQLLVVGADELTFGLWKSEQPQGTVLAEIPRYAHDYAPQNWDVAMAKAPTVISYAQAGLKPRDLMLGIRAFGGSRAFPYSIVLKEKLIEDRVNGEPVPLVVGADAQSVRVFRHRVPQSTVTTQFYRILEGLNKDAAMMDAETGSEWNFQGCAISGKRKGACLERVEVIKDYWFDWRNYNPDTTVYGIKEKIR